MLKKYSYAMLQTICALLCMTSISARYSVRITHIEYEKGVDTRLDAAERYYHRRYQKEDWGLLARWLQEKNLQMASAEKSTESSPPIDN